MPNAKAMPQSTPLPIHGNADRDDDANNQENAKERMNVEREERAKDPTVENGFFNPAIFNHDRNEGGFLQSR